MSTSDRPARPVPSAPRKYRFPAFERATTPNGTHVIVAPVRKLPIATVVFLADAGASTEGAGAAGTAQLTAKLILEGTSALDGAQIADRFERLGASVEAHADWDVASVSMTVLASELEEAFALATQVLREPAFREPDVERFKGERLAELVQLRAEPRGLADESFSQLLYRPLSRYAIAEGGDEASIAPLDGAALRSFFASRYGAGAMTVIAVGDVEPAAIIALVERYLKPGGARAGSASAVDDQPASLTRAIAIIAKPDAPQSELRIGHVGVPRLTPDYFPIVVMNAVLGGLFNSRINLNLREEHGYTYGAFSGFDWRRQAGPFVVSTAVKSDVTAAATTEVLAEIDRMRQSPIHADELSLAISYLDGVFPIRYETTSAIASALAGMVVYELPEDYFDSYRHRIRAVTLADVQHAAVTYLRPDSLQILAVGDPAAIHGPLSDLALGPVTVTTPGEAPVG